MNAALRIEDFSPVITKILMLEYCLGTWMEPDEAVFMGRWIRDNIPLDERQMYLQMVVDDFKESYKTAPIRLTMSAS